MSHEFSSLMLKLYLHDFLQHLYTHDPASFLTGCLPTTRRSLFYSHKPFINIKTHPLFFGFSDDSNYTAEVLITTSINNNKKIITEIILIRTTTAIITIM